MTSKNVFAPRARRDTPGFACDLGFIGDGTEQVFVSITVPRGPTLGSAVICSPVHADFARNYRAEVVLGQALATRGVVTARFHYRGLGHSYGDPARMTLESMIADAEEAVRLVRDRFGVEHLCFVGCRLGGYVAAAIAADHPRSPLVLWEPVLKPTSYLREAGRALRLASLAEAGDVERSHGADVAIEFERRGFIDVHGYPVRKVLAESFDRPLQEVLGDTPRALKVLQFGRGGKERPDYGAAVAEWRAKGFQVDLGVMGGDVSWWSRGVREERDDHTRKTAGFVRTTADWILSPEALGRAQEGLS